MCIRAQTRNSLGFFVYCMTLQFSKRQKGLWIHLYYILVQFLFIYHVDWCWFLTMRRFSSGYTDNLVHKHLCHISITVFSIYVLSLTTAVLLRGCTLCADRRGGWICCLLCNEKYIFFIYVHNFCDAWVKTKGLMEAFFLEQLINVNDVKIAFRFDFSSKLHSAYAAVINEMIHQLNDL